MKKLFVLAPVLVLSACGMFGEKDDEVSVPKPPKVRMKFIKGPVVHPITGRHCNPPGGICEGEIPAPGKSGCHSAEDKCPLVK
jgi:hypothetical protein